MKTFLRWWQAFLFTAAAIIIGLMVWNVRQPLEAQPASSTRLRDLGDVRIATTPANGNVLAWDAARGRWTNAAPSGGSGGTVGLSDFNSNQFSTNGGTVSVKSGATTTNLVLVSPKTGNLLPTSSNPLYPLMVENPDGSGGNRDVSYGTSFFLTGTNGFLSGILNAGGAVATNSLTLPFGTANTLLSLNGSKAAASVANGVGLLTNDGSGGFGFTTNVTQAVTYNNFTTTNLTVLNSLTVSNISVTNVTVQNNLTVSNLYTVNGNHALLIVTNAVRMPWVTLTMTGSNVSTIDFNAGSMFRLLATNNAFLTAPSNLPGTNVSQTIQFAFIQDGTGTRTLTVTNGSWELSGSGTSTNQVAAVNTNANAITYLTFVTSPNSATKVHGVVAAIGQ